MNLALDYRPQRFADVVGQDHIKPILRAMVKHGRVATALLFVGSRGTGKTTCGRIFSAALNCDSPEDGDSCGKCDSCIAVQEGNSFSVIEIDAASHGLVDNIRQIKEMVEYSHNGKWRVVMLDEAHSMSKAAFNALLKVLEEPPERTVFILLTTEADKILPTVASRSMSFEFRRLTNADIVGRLQEISDERGLGTTPELLALIAEKAQGGMRDAVMLLDQISTIGISDVAEFKQLFGISDVALPVLVAAANADFATGISIIEKYFHHTGDASALVSDLIELLRDLLVIHSGGDPRPIPQSEQRAELAAQLTLPKLIASMRVLWELKGRVKATDSDQRSSMYMAFALLVDELLDKKLQEPIPTGEETGQMNPRLSLDDMRKMVATLGRSS